MNPKYEVSKGMVVLKLKVTWNFDNTSRCCNKVRFKLKDTSCMNTLLNLSYIGKYLNKWGIVEKVLLKYCTLDCRPRKMRENFGRRCCKCRNATVQLAQLVAHLLPCACWHEILVFCTKMRLFIHMVMSSHVVMYTHYKWRFKLIEMLGMKRGYVAPVADPEF